MRAGDEDVRPRVTALRIWLQRRQKPLWLALVVTVFCVPLFVGLGRTDLRNDEAIYSYAVDSILETGDWLNPRSSPNADIVFLEKPPLKFWLVALPMQIGLLPHNEFGFRIWDALFGSVAFLYVFALGRRIAGPLCGLFALFVLSAFQGLWFEHGLRDNVMEASLVLAYCGGIFHFLRWSESTDSRPRRRHALAVGLLFVVGFMTKFVAVLFLPMILAATMLFVPGVFAKARRDRRLWGGVAALAAALIVPWFAYEAVHMGCFLWDVMFAAHVVQRLTGTLSAEHLQPWTFYFSEIYASTREFGLLWLAAAGALLIGVRSVRERWPDGVAVLIWFALPLTLMSLTTSKLSHYLYPFLPPFALACGYVLCWVLETSGTPIGRLLKVVDEWSARLKMPRHLRTAFVVFGVVSAAIAVFALVYGGFEIRVGNTRIFSTRSSVRPMVFALVFGFLGARRLAIGQLARIVVVMMLVPIRPHRENLSHIAVEQHTLRAARDCVLDVRDREQSAGRATPALLVALPADHFVHPIYFYLRDAGFSWANPLSDEELDKALHTAGLQRPVLIPLDRYVDFVEARSRVPGLPGPAWLSTWGGPMPSVDAWFRRAQALGAVDLQMANVQLLLPGSYAGCGTPSWGPLLPTPQSASSWRLEEVAVPDSVARKR